MVETVRIVALIVGTLSLLIGMWEKYAKNDTVEGVWCMGFAIINFMAVYHL